MILFVLGSRFGDKLGSIQQYAVVVSYVFHLALNSNKWVALKRIHILQSSFRLLMCIQNWNDADSIPRANKYSGIRCTFTVAYACVWSKALDSKVFAPGYDCMNGWIFGICWIRVQRRGSHCVVCTDRSAFLFNFDFQKFFISQSRSMIILTIPDGTYVLWWRQLSRCRCYWYWHWSTVRDHISFSSFHFYSIENT